MEKLEKKNIDLITAVTMTIFSLFVTFTGTFSWFFSKVSQSRAVDQFAIYNVDSEIKTLSYNETKCDDVHSVSNKKIVNREDININNLEFDYIYKD